MFRAEDKQRQADAKSRQATDMIRRKIAPLIKEATDLVHQNSDPKDTCLAILKWDKRNPTATKILQQEADKLLDQALSCESPKKSEAEAKAIAFYLELTELNIIERSVLSDIAEMLQRKNRVFAGLTIYSALLKINPDDIISLNAAKKLLATRKKINISNVELFKPHICKATYLTRFDVLIAQHKEVVNFTFQAKVSWINELIEFLSKDIFDYNFVDEENCSLLQNQEQFENIMIQHWGKYGVFFDQFKNTSCDSKSLLSLFQTEIYHDQAKKVVRMICETVYYLPRDMRGLLTPENNPNFWLMIEFSAAACADDVVVNGTEGLPITLSHYNHKHLHSNDSAIYFFNSYLNHMGVVNVAMPEIINDLINLQPFFKKLSENICDKDSLSQPQADKLKELLTDIPIDNFAALHWFIKSTFNIFKLMALLPDSIQPAAYKGSIQKELLERYQSIANNPPITLKSRLAIARRIQLVGEILTKRHLGNTLNSTVNIILLKDILNQFRNGTAHVDEISLETLKEFEREDNLKLLLEELVELKKSLFLLMEEIQQSLPSNSIIEENGILEMEQYISLWNAIKQHPMYNPNPNTELVFPPYIPNTMLLLKKPALLKKFLKREPLPQVEIVNRVFAGLANSDDLIIFQDFIDTYKKFKEVKDVGQAYRLMYELLGYTLPDQRDKCRTVVLGQQPYVDLGLVLRNDLSEQETMQAKAILSRAINCYNKGQKAYNKQIRTIHEQKLETKKRAYENSKATALSAFPIVTKLSESFDNCHFNKHDFGTILTNLEDRLMLLKALLNEEKMFLEDSNFAKSINTALEQDLEFSLAISYLTCQIIVLLRPLLENKQFNLPFSNEEFDMLTALRNALLHFDPVLESQHRPYSHMDNSVVSNMMAQFLEKIIKSEGAIMLLKESDELSKQPNAPTTKQQSALLVYSIYASPPPQITSDDSEDIELESSPKL